MNKQMTEQEIRDEMNDAEQRGEIKEYTFGMQDAFLHAAKKAFYVIDPLRMTISRHETYREAAGKARMIVAINKSL